MLMACLLSPSFLWPSMSWALGLGEIHLNSALNEPMNAEIELIAASPDELAALRATLAGREAFTRYGIDRPPFLSSLTFKAGKSKDGRDVLLVRSTDAIPEPFVTFLVEVNWARGRLMREYTVLLDPPVYTPGESAASSAPVAAPTTARHPASAGTCGGRAVAGPEPCARGQSSGAESCSPPRAMPQRAPRPTPAGPISGNTYQVGSGDTLSKIARSLAADSPGGATPAAVDQTMMAVYRANPDAFGGNINILRRGAVLRVPGGDQIAAMNQSEAISEVQRQMNAWRAEGGGAAGGHLRLVTPGAGGSSSGSAESSAGGAEAQALKDRVKDLEGQLAESHRLIDIRNSELSALQRKLGVPPTAPSPAPVPAPSPTQSTPAPAVAAHPPVAPVPPEPAASAAMPPAEQSTPAPVPAPAPAPVVKKPAAIAAESGSWIDWIAANWWVPAAVIIALIVLLAFAAWRRRQGGIGDLNRMAEDRRCLPRPPVPSSACAATTRSWSRNPANIACRNSTRRPTASATRTPMSKLPKTPCRARAQSISIRAIRWPKPISTWPTVCMTRRPTWCASLSSANRIGAICASSCWRSTSSGATRTRFCRRRRDWKRRATARPPANGTRSSSWASRFARMKRCFAGTAGSGRGAGALVDLNLEGGENRVDIDLFGDPEGERSRLDHSFKGTDDSAPTGESPALHASSDLDFTLDTPERGADESPTREMPPRDEPTVESEMMSFNESPTAESPVLKSNDVRDRISSKLGSVKADQTAEVSIDDLGLDLDQLEATGSPAVSGSHLEETDHPADAPTMVAGLDENSRRMMAEAESRSRDKDLTELERELEASFVADLGSDHEEIKTAVLGPESAPHRANAARLSMSHRRRDSKRRSSPTLQMPRRPMSTPPRSFAA